MRAIQDVLGGIYRNDRALLEGLARDEINAADTDGRTPLMHAVLAGDPDIVRVLLKRGADPNAADYGRRWTALHFAADNEQADNVRSLLDAGAAVDPVDTFGNTPLWRAVMSSTQRLDTIEALLEHGADPRKQNVYGKAPMDIARDAGLQEVTRLMTTASKRPRDR